MKVFIMSWTLPIRDLEDNGSRIRLFSTLLGAEKSRNELRRKFSEVGLNDISISITEIGVDET